jgi:hypothetical protein
MGRLLASHVSVEPSGVEGVEGVPESAFARTLSFEQAVAMRSEEQTKK